MKQPRLNQLEIGEQEKQMAYFKSCGYSKQEIANNFACSQATVDRRLKAAEKKGIYTEKHVIKLNLPSPKIQELKLFTFANHLAQKLINEVGRRCVEKITIVRSSMDERENIERVGRTAALRLFQMKDQLGNVGVSWGRTVAATATAAKKISSTQNLNDNKKLRFIPIVGDFLIPQIEGYNLEASTIAAELTRALGADIETQAALNVPASLPEDFFEGNPTEIATHKEIIRSFLTTLPDYQSLFGNRDNRNDKPLIQSLDTIISGCGFIDSNGGNLSVEDRMDSKYFNLTRHIQEPEREALRQAASGDLCSRLIASQNASTKGKELVQAINQRVFAAPTLEDIQLCKERSRDEETLGVVIVASGAEKSPVLTQICLAGLVSELIIDQQLANRMAQTFGIDPLPLLQL